MQEFEVVLSYTFRVTAETWAKALELARKATIPLPHCIQLPQHESWVELEVEVGEGFEIKEAKDGREG